VICGFFRRRPERWELVEADGCSGVRASERTFTSDHGTGIDLVVLDLHLPYVKRDDLPPPSYGTGTDHGRWIHEHYPDTAIVVLSNNEFHDAVTRSSDFTEVVIEKENFMQGDGEELEEAIDAVFDQRPLRRARDDAVERAALAKRYGFTSRQLDVLAHVRDGLGNVEIARALHLSDRTVERHKAAIATRIASVRELSLGADGDYPDRGALLRWFVEDTFSPRR
jgi:DNA-binding NarL/FixJ family response regulator